MISVIIPAYNSVNTIAQAIESALQQKVDLEILVIDDGSSDDLDTLMEQYTHDERIRYLKNEHNMGPSATRNRGIECAGGEYIAFLDSDDYWEEGKLQKQLTRIEETKAVLCSTGRELITWDGQPMDRVISVKERITFEDMLKQNWINNSSVLVRREVLLEFPLEADDIHEDYLLWLKVIRKYGFACAIDEPLLKYRMSKNSKSGNKIKSAVMTYKTYRRLGMKRLQAWRSFVSYAIAGVSKYYG